MAPFMTYNGEQNITAYRGHNGVINFIIEGSYYSWREAWKYIQNVSPERICYPEPILRQAIREMVDV